MPSTSLTQGVVPYGADQTVYFVIDRFGKFSSVHCETEVERTDREAVITDLMSGQFNDPIRVVAFNTLEHWSEDVSNDIALEIQTALRASPVRPGSWPWAGLIDAVSARRGRHRTASRGLPSSLSADGRRHCRGVPENSRSQKTPLLIRRGTSERVQ